MAYAISFPDRMARQSVLRITGHAYWHAAIATAIVGALWFSVSHAARHLRAGSRLQDIHQPWARTFATLASLQFAVFLGMEFTERLTAGAPVATIFDRHVLAIGLGVQVLVAAVLAVATYLVARAAFAVGRALAARVPRPSRARVVWALPRQHWPVALAVVPCGTRGPPLRRR